MNNITDERLNRLAYMLDEIKELVQHNKDMINDRELMLEDLKLIAKLTNPQDIKLYGNYFIR